MRTLTIDIKRPDHRYDILVGANLFRNWTTEVDKRAPGGKRMVVADRRVADLHRLEAELAGQAGWELVPVDAGEDNKTLAAYVALCETLLARGIGRKDVVVAVGGGVIGDLAGFAAATLLRGLRFVQIPTTLLAQVDSSVGGKTGVNAAAGKNLVGAFHQPEFVLIDPLFLNTLPEREYLAGLAEVLKYGIIGDREFFDLLVSSAGTLAQRNQELLAEAIAKCCRMKADIVAADERETGSRALLNLGHTFGHALEALAGYNGTVVHGEAVAVGMAMAAAFAVKKGLMDIEGGREVAAALDRLGLPARVGDLGHSGGLDGTSKKTSTRSVIDWPRLMTPDRVAALLAKDKKGVDGSLTLILPRAIGECKVEKGFSVVETANFMIEYAAGGWIA